MIPVFIRAVQYFATFLQFLILARVIMSWLPNMRGSAVGQFLFALSEPILGPVRKLLQKTPLGGPGMMLDLAPIASFLIILFSERLIIGVLLSLQ